MNLTKKEVRLEVWGMLTDKAKKEMALLKRSYLNSVMADIESYHNGQMLKFLQERYGCTGIVSIEQSVSPKNKLKVCYKKGDPMYFDNYHQIIEFIKSEDASNDQ